MEEGLRTYLNGILTTKSRIRCNVRFTIEEKERLDERGHFKELLKRDVFSGLLKEYLKNNNFNIEEEMVDGCFEYRTDVFIFDTKLLKQVIEAYISFLDDYQLDKIRNKT
jgi:hypothetical protein